MTHRRTRSNQYRAAVFRETGDLYDPGYEPSLRARILRDYLRHGIPMGPRLDRAPSVLDADDLAPLFAYATRTKDGPTE